MRTFEFVNEGGLDIVSLEGSDRPAYDRALTVELWHPAAAGTEAGTTYDVTIRDGEKVATLRGAASRDAAPAADGPFPLVIISHGYPGNRYLLAHLGEHLASHGYVVASIDHLESTYATQSKFGSTLVNRPFDQKFVIDQVEAMGAEGGPLAGVVDASRHGVVGY